MSSYVITPIVVGAREREFNMHNKHTPRNKSERALKVQKKEKEMHVKVASRVAQPDIAAGAGTAGACDESRLRSVTFLSSGGRLLKRAELSGIH